MGKFFDAEGKEVEAYAPDEVQAQVSTAVTAKETEFAGVKTDLETKLGDANTRLKERAGEFAQFRKLSEEAVTKLSAAERTIYENGLALEEERVKRVDAEKRNHDTMVESTIKGKAGTNEKLVTKMKEMWSVFGIEANTQEQMEQKATMILGAISTTEPDLVATVAGFSGGHLPPKEQIKDGETFADTERGKKGAAELGLDITPPKQQ